MFNKVELEKKIMMFNTVNMFYQFVIYSSYLF